MKVIKSFRKKPLVIQACQLALDNFEEVELWCHGSLRGIRLPHKEWELEIFTLEGDLRAAIGDWIIKGVEGEFYPCKARIFETTYEEVV